MRKLLIVLAALTLVFAACAKKSTETTGTAQPTSTSAMSGSTTVHLAHMPRGTAQIAYDAYTKKLTVTVSATGLSPGTTHYEGIGKGSCTSGQGPLYPLDALVADKQGVAKTTTVIANIAAVPSGAFVHIHTGPTKDNKGRGLACADLAGSAGTLTLGPDATDGSSGSNVTGTVVLTLDAAAKTLTVKLVADGLAPGSSHPSHIHLGSCESQGPVVLALGDVKADSAGHAAVTTTLPKVSSIDFGAWYVNLHQGPGLATQEQFAPVACGNVTR
jgi:hypothetical protein